MISPAKPTSSDAQNDALQNTTATIEIAVAGRRPHARRVNYTRLVAAIDALESTATTNKWLKRLIANKLTQARACALVIHAEVRDARAL
jgi:hypothetical protein